MNGVYSYNREAKIDPTRVKAIFDKAASMYLEKHSTYTAGSGLGIPAESAGEVLPTGVAKPA